MNSNRQTCKSSLEQLASVSCLSRAHALGLSTALNEDMERTTSDYDIKGSPQLSQPLTPPMLLHCD